ncbi:MAG: HAD hydrolase family protein [Chloroflexi bacterium]|nr:HAD hydrolase family protein [Chloroflexota bacterium]
MPNLKNVAPIETQDMAKWVRALVPVPKVLYSDVDGTLLGPGGCLFFDAQQNLTLEPARAIMACHLSKIDVVLVSGRGRLQLLGDARVFGFENWVAELGCLLVYDKGELIVRNIGDFEPGEETVYRAIAQSGAPDLLFHKYQGRLEYHKPWSDERECSHLLRGLIDVSEANKLLAEAGFAKMKLIDNGRVHRTSPGLSLDLPEVHAYHLLPKGSGKASAVRKDRELRGIPRESTIAIGDAESDLELADEVGIFFLVANALYESRDIERLVAEKDNVIVTKRAMGLGWAEAIGYLTGFCF